jgi:uncharacterized protein YndB with AHSA1/START domain
VTGPESAAPVVEIERLLPARPEIVFRALTERGLYGRWMGPAGSAVTVEELDARVDGRISFTVRLPDGGPEFRLHGVYREIVPSRRLVHTWAVEGDPAESTVTFELEPIPSGTRLALTHRGLTPDDIAQNDAGWRHQLDRLEAVLAG